LLPARRRGPRRLDALVGGPTLRGCNNAREPRIADKAT
jgi:hypothetical protein